MGGKNHTQLSWFELNACNACVKEIFLFRVYKLILHRRLIANPECLEVK